MVKLVVCTLNNHFFVSGWLCVRGGPKCVSECASITHCSHIRGYQSLLNISLFALLWEENSPSWYQDISVVDRSLKLPGTFWAYRGTWPVLSSNAPKRDLTNFSPSHTPSLLPLQPSHEREFWSCVFEQNLGWV